MSADSTYGLFVCGTAPETYHEYDFLASEWISGSTVNEVLHSGWPFFNLFDDCDKLPVQEQASCTGGTNGYTHGDILQRTLPNVTPYTYDTLMHYYKL